MKRQRLRWISGVFFVLVFGPLLRANEFRTTGKPPCVDPPGTSTENGSSTGAATSSQPVRYLDGLLLYRTPSLGFSSLGGSWSFYLTYNNRPEAYFEGVDEGFGSRWRSSVPRISQRSSTRLQLVLDGHNACEFIDDPNDQSDKYFGKHGIWASIRLDDDGYWKLKGTNGGEVWFYGPGSNNKGKIYKAASPQGQVWQFHYNGGGDPHGGTYLSQITEPNGLSWQFFYGALGGRVDYIEVISGGEKIAEIDLEYYTGGEDGSAGDLKGYTIKEKRNGTFISRTTHFRYYVGSWNGNPEDPNYNPGTDHDLKLVVGPMASKWAEKQTGLSFDQIPTGSSYQPQDGSLIKEKYFDIYVKYDQYHRVIEEEARNGGSCTCGGGSSVGTYYYSYQTRSGSGDYNWPKYAVEQQNPDGSILYVEVNEIGCLVSKVLCGDGKRWAWVNVYDEYGHLIEKYHPSACDAGTYGFPSWSGGEVTKLNSGIVEVYEYSKPTDPYFSEYPEYCGKIKKEALRIGQSGTERVLREYEYVDPEGSRNDLVPRHLRLKREWETEQSSVQTLYDYIFYNDDINKIQKKTIERPGVTNPGSQLAYRYEYYNQYYGFLTKVVDEEGVTTEFNYNTTTGLLTDRWQDSQGVCIYEKTEYDSLQRVISKTLYKGSNSTSGILQRRRWEYTYMPKESTNPNETNYFPRFVTLAYEHILEESGNVSSRDGAVAVTVEDLDHKIVEEAVCRIDSSQTGAPLSSDFLETATELCNAFPNGVLFERKTYEYVGGFLRKLHEWQNPELTWEEANAQTKLNTTEYEYDVKGRVKYILDPEGTITWKEYNLRDLLTKLKVSVSGGANITEIERRYYDQDDSGNEQGGLNGLLTEVELPAGGDTCEIRKKYDKWNRLVYSARKIDASGSKWGVTKYTYDNLDRVTTTETYLGGNPQNWDEYYYNSEEASDLWHLRRASFYDERGRVYRTEEKWSKVASSGELEPGGTTYVTKIWHDKVGRVIKKQSPGLMFEKMGYDGPGRLLAMYLCFDTDEGDSFGAADDVNGDVVLREERYEYDKAGREIFTTAYERNPGEDSSWTVHYGSLSGQLFPAGYARRTYSGSWYSPAGRLTAVADWGDNGGQDLTRPSEPPSREDALVTEYEEGFGYQNEEPLSWVKVTDPSSKISYQYYDALGRQVKVVRNYVDGIPSVYLKGQVYVQDDVTVTFEYDKMNRIVRAIAQEFASGGSVQKQVTAYEYGVRMEESEASFKDSYLDTNNLLHRILYGTRTEDSESFSRQVVFAYNEQGSFIWKASGDAQSPPAFQAEHEYTFDHLGRLRRDEVTAAAAGVNTDVDAIDYTYDSHGRTVKVESLKKTGPDTYDTVNWVSRSYDSDGYLTKSTQAPGVGCSRTVSFTYSSGSYPIKRLSKITYPSYTDYPRYVYIFRSGESASEDWERKDWVTGRISSLSDSWYGDQSSGHVGYKEYMGFGRVMKMALGYSEPITLSVVDRNDTSKLSVDRFGRVPRLYGTGDSGRKIVDYTYSYDMYHSPVSRLDGGPVNQNEYYLYDDLSRLIKRTPERGASRAWELTAVGNWKEVKDGTNVVDVRGHNERNEITIRMYQGVFAIPGYDTEGNTTKLPVDTGGGSFTCVYDAWNRLCAIKDGDTELLKYLRDGLGRIVKKEFYLGETYVYFYSPSWQVVSVFDPYGTIQKEYIWGVRYVDELLESITYSNGSSPTRRYHLQDINWNIVATVDETGVPLELVTYDPYGEPSFYTGSGSPKSSLISDYGADHLFQGRWLECLQSGTTTLRLYHFRNRAYGPVLGRFLQRDPLYELTGNVYEFLESMPLLLVDPSGLSTIPTAPTVCPPVCSADEDWLGYIEKARKVVVGVRKLMKEDEPKKGRGQYSDNAKQWNEQYDKPARGTRNDIDGDRTPCQEKHRNRKWLFKGGCSIKNNNYCAKIEMKVTLRYNGCDILGVSVKTQIVPPFPKSTAAKGRFEFLGSNAKPVRGCECCNCVICRVIRYDMDAERWTYHRFWPIRKWKFEGAGQGTVAVEVCGDGTIRELDRDTMGDMTISPR